MRKFSIGRCIGRGVRHAYIRKHVYKNRNKKNIYVKTKPNEYPKYSMKYGIELFDEHEVEWISRRTNELELEGFKDKELKEVINREYKVMFKDGRDKKEMIWRIEVSIFVILVIASFFYINM